MTPRSSTIVVDASVLLDALTSDGAVGDAAREALRGQRWAAPEHLRIETFHVVRRRLLRNKIAIGTAEDAIEDLSIMELEIVPTTLLLERMWELRDNLSGYDAAYVAAAEHLGVPLVTSDKRLAIAPGVRCEVRIP